MAEAIAARQFGDEYQQLVFWKYALRMLESGSGIEKIRYEDEAVKSFDDIVIEYTKPQIFRNTTVSKEYIQVKFHMRNNGLFTWDGLLDPSFVNAPKNSLLHNVTAAYRKLGEEFKSSVFVIYFVWDIKQEDLLSELINNTDGTIYLKKLFDGTTERSRMGKIRKQLCKALKVNEEELQCIFRQIRIASHPETIEDLKENLSVKLKQLGLKTISKGRYTNPYTQLIQELNKQGHQSFDKASLNAILEYEELYVQKHKVFYSVNSFIAYKINEKYYNGQHYIWCAPAFDCLDNPDASNPKQIFQALMNAVRTRADQDTKILQNKMGLYNGVEEKYKKQLIDEAKRREIIGIIERAEVEKFRPIIYVIPYEAVKDKIYPAKIEEKADPFSSEYKIEVLKSEEFELIDLRF